VKRIKEARERRGITQAELAGRCNLHVTAISAFESGRRSPCIENLIKLAIALRVSVDWLLDIRVEGIAMNPASIALVKDFDRMMVDDQDVFCKLAKMIADKPRTVKGCAE